MFDCDRVGFWVPFESLLASWAELAGFLELDLLSLEHKQNSPDFEKFGYTKQSWKQQVNVPDKSNIKRTESGLEQVIQPKRLKKVVILTQFTSSRASVLFESSC
jgi:hypothetical protein